MPAHVKADRLCLSCRVRKPRTAFASSAARRCLECWQGAMRASICRACGSPAPLSVEGQPRAYCDDPACQTAKLDAARAVHLAALAARPRPAELRCVACAVTKPVAEFPVARRNDDGSVRRFDPYCRLCRAVYQRLRYHTEPAIREEALEKARRQRAEINRRRAEDPEFDRECRTHIRERERVYRKTMRNKRERPNPSRGRPLFDTEQLPSGPLAEWIYAAADGDQNQLELVCQHADIHPRTALYWRSGGRHLVPLWQADKVLIGLNLLWWEVWNEQTVRRPLLTVTLCKRRARSLPSGNKIYTEYGERYYGDAGPDHERLAEIQALWIGSPVELAA